MQNQNEYTNSTPHPPTPKKKKKKTYNSKNQSAKFDMFNEVL